MGKLLFKIFLFILIVAVLVIIFLSFVGLETDKFDNLIKSKANEVNQNIKLGFKKTKIHINPKEFNLVVKLQNPKILIRENEINLLKLDLYLPLQAFFTSDFLLEKAEVSFKENDIKDLAKITRIFLPRIINKKINKIFEKGSIEGEFIIPFNNNGKIDKNYGFFGKISDASINLNKELAIKNLTTEIKRVKTNEFSIFINKGSIKDIKLDGSEIILEREERETKIKSLLKTKGKLNFSEIKKISSLFKINVSKLKDIYGDIDLETNLDFNLNKSFKIDNLSYLINGNIINLIIDSQEEKVIRRYIPDYDRKFVFKNVNLKLAKSKSDVTLEAEGLIKIKKNFDKFKLKEIYNFSKKNFDIKGAIDLTNLKVNVPKLNYGKDSGLKSEVKFSVNFIFGKYFNIDNLNYIADKNRIDLFDIKLNKFYEVKDFKKISVKTFNNKTKNNDFNIKKSKQILIEGSIFDLQPLLKNIYKKSDRKTFSKNFTSEIKINFDKALTGTGDDVSKFAMIAFINKGSYDKLSLKGNFSKNEFIEMSIYQVGGGKKTLQVISDRARPFIRNFDFIKGFEGGKLEYESIISKESSDSNLLISNFKVSKVPALAKLLSLASLQGIADTLSGEGIRFDSFEMKSNTVNNVMNIEDALAMGPAISILLNGYVDKGKTVSLRGTLVPATKLNSIIASIPLVGGILVGKKIGEGVVGVSFKMKGPPKDIKTTVNPIKTLTPRFIVRAVENMKKKKQKETK